MTTRTWIAFATFLGIVVVLLALAASPARAEPATGFMVQGLIASNLMVGGAYYGPNFTVMPALRLGGQLRRIAVAAELNYSTFAELDGTDNGLHLIAVGPNLQPVIWASAEGNARLAIACGFNVGAVVQTRSSSTSSRSDSFVTGGFNGALHGGYFLHPSFAPGPAGGVRAQIFNFEGDHVVVAAVYVALSLTFVAGK